MQVNLIDPNDLDIDLPLDERNVSELMESINEVGEVLNEVLVREQDYRIIDGFHRTEACKRLGLPVPIKLIPCTEEQFWSLRIVQAKKHHEVEDQRLVAWMLECWKRTKWYVPISPDKDGFLPRAYSNTSVDLTMVEMVWTVFRLKWPHGTHSEKVQPLTRDEQELSQWMDAKANQWGVDARKIANSVLALTSSESGFLDNQTFDDYSRKYNFDFQKATRIQKEMSADLPRYDQVTHAYLMAVSTGKNDTETYQEFNKRVLLENAEQKRLEREKQDARRPVVAEYTPTQRQTDEGGAKYNADRIARDRRNNVISMLREIKNWVRGLEPNLREVEDGQILFAAFVTDMANTHEKLWPSAKTGNGQVDSHNRIYALERQVESLQRALGTKQGLHVTTDQMALPSTAISRLRS